MRTKVLMIVAVALAVIAAATAAVVVSMKRADEARSYKEAEAAQEAAAEAEKRTAQKNTEAEAEKRRAAEENRKAKEAELAAAKVAKETAQLEAKTAEENRKAKEAEAVRAKANSETANANREAEREKAKAARDEREKAVKAAEAATARAQAEQAKLDAEKVKAEKVLAEAKVLELRRTDYEALQLDLLEWKRDLEEREAALRPEKTVADLSWVGGDEDMEVGSNGTVRVKQKVPYLAENDHALPRETRHLARAERIMTEKSAEHASEVRASIVKPLEALYVAALREGRVIDADFYHKSLKSLYPDWEFRGVEKKEESK